MDAAAVAAVPARMLLFLSLFGLPSGLVTRQRSCPAFCHCELDGILLRVDCADLGLADVPANLSVFTSYLDLSMNNISKLSLNSLHKLRFLEELRLAGNSLTYIPRGAFAGQFRLKVLMLQNNLLSQVPSEALQNLHSLQSLTGASICADIFEECSGGRKLHLDPCSSDYFLSTIAGNI